MCLIAVQPVGSRIDLRGLRHAWEHGNDDGAGYMFSVGGKLIVRKPFWKLSEFLRALQDDMAECAWKSPFVIHLRAATHGAMSAENTHPHLLDDGRVGLVHNGILTDYSGDRATSDTVLFSKLMLGRLSKEILLHRKFVDDLGIVIGQGNKFALLGEIGRASCRERV